MRTKKYLFIALLITFSLKPAIGCMERTKHGLIRHGYDYKKLHYVECACNCLRYRWGEKGTRCINCWHYHNPNEVIAINYVDLSPSCLKHIVTQ